MGNFPDWKSPEDIRRLCERYDGNVTGDFTIMSLALYYYSVKIYVNYCMSLTCVFGLSKELLIQISVWLHSSAESFSNQ